LPSSASFLTHFTGSGIGGAGRLRHAADSNQLQRRPPALALGTACVCDDLADADYPCPIFVRCILSDHYLLVKSKKFPVAMQHNSGIITAGWD
jgi:hypothetical protein